MPTHNQSRFPSPDPDPDENIVPSELADDDALWMLLNTYADGEATSEEVLRVERLLGSNPGVAREFAFLKLTADSVREFGEVDPPAALTGAIFAATTRRKTLFQRVRAWWAEAGAAFGPAPLRIGGAALASGILAVVLWSKYNAVQPPRHDVSSPVIVRNPSSRGAENHLAAAQPPSHAPVVHVPQNFVPFGPRVEDVTPLASADVRGPIGPLHDAFMKSSVPPPQIVKSPPSTGGGIHRDSPARAPKTDAQPSNSFVARPPNVEERHMAADIDTGRNVTKPDDLGPDVDTAVDTHTGDQEVAKATPPASYDEPPTTVAAVTYRPGSISDQIRSAPPPVQTLYMKTQEAIRRQHDLQQYGGYGKDTYNNIQRREVGLSLVGGRF